ncbi:MAG: SDR family NAD(P)-dependent oxidoreductase [Oligoflexia bacterium]|nr:SDR family NAD(P)-dependent oxidoreductase [Oligoflexia bacterium]
MSLLLENKLMFITGATKGLGRALALVCAREGANIAFTYNKNIDDAKSLQHELEAMGRKSYCHQLDVRDVEQSKHLAAGMEKEGLNVDVLINNAGVSQVVHLSMMDEEDFDFVMDTNVKGVFFVTKAFLKGMIKRRKGKIINISSLAGVHLIKAPVHYAASKAAVAGFTMALSKEVAPFNITVNGVAPGLLDEGVGVNVPENYIKEYIQHNSLGRLGKSDEVAEFVSFMASDRNTYLNGETVVLAGGL